MHPTYGLLAGMLWATAAGAAPIPDPFTTQDLQSYLASAQPASVEDLLAALPASAQENMVLVHASRSLQPASPAAPRQILFGWDGRMLIAAGSAPDPTVEVAEFDPATGLYHFSEISFASGQGVLDQHPTVCANCHGQPQRPIWHAYGDWPGVYLDEDDTVSSHHAAAFAAFAAAAPTDPRYEHLKWTLNDDGFSLLERIYAYPNTVMNFVLGSTVSIGTLQRMRLSARYPQAKWAVFALSAPVGCTGANAPNLFHQIDADYAQVLAQDSAFGARYADAPTSDQQVKLFRLLGIDPGPELNLTELAPGAPELPQAFWDAGGNSLDTFIAEQLVPELAAADPSLNALVPAMTMLSSDLTWMTATGRDRIPLHNYPCAACTLQNALQPQLATVCADLESRYLGAAH